jgi:hypothetical protein
MCPSVLVSAAAEAQTTQKSEIKNPESRLPYAGEELSTDSLDFVLCEGLSQLSEAGSKAHARSWKLFSQIVI